MRTQKWIPLIVVLQCVILLGQWLGVPHALSTADAQMADPGRDRAQTLEVLRSIDAKLDKMDGLFASGKLQVRLASTDEGKGSGGR